MTELKPYSEYWDSGVEWLGFLPTSWNVRAIKDLAFLRGGGTPDSDNDAYWATDCNGSPWIAIGDLKALEAGQPTQRRITRAGLSVARLKVTEPPVVLFAMYASVGETAYLNYEATWNQALVGLDARVDSDPRFLFWALKSMKPALPYFYRSNTQDNVNANQVGNLRLAVPPLAEQRRIADYLDRETAEIDAFIADQEELIGLLAERRDATWQSAIDDMQAPEVPLRRVVASIVDGPFGSSLTSAHYSDDGARVIRLGNIGINEFKGSDEAFISMDYFSELQSHVAMGGDVVVAGLGDDRMPLGRAAVVPDIGPAIVKADCYRVRPNSLTTGEYLAWALSAPQTRARFTEISRGSTRQRLNTSVVRDVFIPLPAIHEQGRVVAESTERLRALEAAISDAREAIALSKERRAALISAAVTGKIDVRGMA